MRIAFETTGHGPPLTLVHGFFGDRTTWHAAGHVAALAAEFRLVLVDLLGHGESEAPRDPDAYRVERQVSDLVAVLDTLGIERTALWGASMGGTLGLHLLARHPERLTALIAGGAHAEAVAADPAEVAHEARLLRTDGTAPFIAALERRGPLPGWMRDAIRAADPHALAALTVALADRPAAEVRSPVPVLLLAGQQDPALPAIRRTAAALPAARLAELPDCAHLDAFTRTDLTLPLVRSFLSPL